MGDFEVVTPVIMESSLKYHPLTFDVLTKITKRGLGQCLVGSLTGAVASQSVTEARERSAQDGRQPSRERKSASGLDCERDTSSRDESRF